MTDKIRRAHLDRKAVVYLRQSTMKQVFEHRESTARQYDLRQRAIALGWSGDSVQIIDEDLGQSGTTTIGRTGFLGLAEEVAHGRVGIILALEVSRLARSSADWHRLLDLCGLADTLIGDEQGVYAPRDPNDRLLLGLKGQMSEAELYWMRLRLQGGKLNKARRGEYRLCPPTGYQWNEGARRLVLDPDEQVQHAVRLLFERFRLDGSARGVVKWFMRNKLRFPSRHPVTGETRWVFPCISILLHFLHNPLYTGAYVFGRREERPALVFGRLKKRVVTWLNRDQWKVCLYDHHPSYIGWEEFMSNQQKLRENQLNREYLEHRGAPREGTALLQGAVICGQCGRRMTAWYQGRRPYYQCRFEREAGNGPLCANLPGPPVDAAVARCFLEVAQPPELELVLAVAREADRQATEVERQWRLRLEHVRYQSRLAERRYKAVDPDNRVVARTLERDWEESLREIERTERDYDEVRLRQKVVLSDKDREQILALSHDLPRVWNSPSAPFAAKKQLLRLLIREVTLTPLETPERVTRIQICWVTGAVSELAVARPTRKTASVTPPAAIERVREMLAGGATFEQIADDLNQRGLTTGKGRPWTIQSVWFIRRRHRLRGPPLPIIAPPPRPDGRLSTMGVAARFGVTPAIVRYWMDKGLLKPDVTPGPRNSFLFLLDDATTARLETECARAPGPRSRKFHFSPSHDKEV